MSAPVPNGRRVVPLDVVARLVSTQFPHWAGLPLTRIEPGGWDNCSFRLGDTMLVRLPSAPWYANQVAREQFWLPRLALKLPLAIPRPLAMGLPSDEFAMAWSVYEWINGEPATTAEIADRATFARMLAGFLAALQRLDPDDGPPPSTDNFWRGGRLAHYDAEVHSAVDRLGNAIERNRVLAVWSAALATGHQGPPVWLHGDVAPGNLLVQSGRLHAVIDFGQCAVGDPACDLAIAWTYFDATARLIFKETLEVDSGCWSRGRGWALWKTLVVAAGISGADSVSRDRALNSISTIISTTSEGPTASTD